MSQRRFQQNSSSDSVASNSSIAKHTYDPNNQPAAAVVSSNLGQELPPPPPYSEDDPIMDGPDGSANYQYRKQQQQQRFQNPPQQQYPPQQQQPPQQPPRQQQPWQTSLNEPLPERRSKQKPTKMKYGSSGSYPGKVVASYGNAAAAAGMEDPYSRNRRNWIIISSLQLLWHVLLWLFERWLMAAGDTARFEALCRCLLLGSDDFSYVRYWFGTLFWFWNFLFILILESIWFASV